MEGSLRENELKFVGYQHDLHSVIKEEIAEKDIKGKGKPGHYGSHNCNDVYDPFKYNDPIYKYKYIEPVYKQVEKTQREGNGGQDYFTTYSKGMPGYSKLPI